MKKLVLGVPVLALALGSTTACATKKFVRGEVGQVNEKVDTLTRSVEENQVNVACAVNSQEFGDTSRHRVRVSKAGVLDIASAHLG